MLLLIFTWEERVPNVELIKDAAKTPHVDGGVVGNTKYDFWGPIESWLDVGVYLLVFKAARPKVNNFDSGLIYFAEQNIFRFQITVHDVVFAQEVEWYQNLDCKALDQRETESLEVVHLDEVVQIHTQQFKRYN